MYEELIKALRFCTEKGECSKCGFYQDGACRNTLMKQAADAIEKLWELFRSAEKDNAKLTAWYVEKCNKHKWIPVTERLPEENGSYLIVNGETVTKIVSEAYYDKDWGDSCWTDPVELYMTYHPTHWMPLPEPPKEKAE